MLQTTLSPATFVQPTAVISNYCSDISDDASRYKACKDVLVEIARTPAARLCKKIKLALRG